MANEKFKEGLRRFAKAVNAECIKDKVNSFDELMTYFLKFPNLFTDSFKKLPEYKRNAIVDLINKAKE